MSITPEQEVELVKFPAVLRMLVEKEVASGNSIVEIGHSSPAPPAGAYVKLANKVSTRARADGDGVSFYERYSSTSSGEFTDAQRFYFVLEPPNPPPEELDMDAIRKSNEPQTNLPEIDSRIIRAQDAEAKLESAVNPPPEREASHAKRPIIESDDSLALSIEESAIGSTRVLHFKDKRPPHEVQFALERSLKTLFTSSMNGGTLCLRAKAKIVGADYDLLLRFEAALPGWNFYSLRSDASWGELPSDHADYYRTTSGSWFAHWTSNFVAASRPLTNKGSEERYYQLCEEALNAENHLESVAAIQQTIVAAMKKGARFCDSHKEGGTNIYWYAERFIRSDYGDNPDHQNFTDEIEFLKMLRQFCHWEVTRNSGKEQLSEIDVWRLILRRVG
jgi:hypothetical protein